MPRRGDLPSGARERNVEPPDGLEPLRDVVPVPQVPDGLEELDLAILVLQVERVLPRVQDQDRDAALAQIGLVIVDLRRQQSAAERLPDERRPARAHDRRRDLRELTLELVE